MESFQLSEWKLDHQLSEKSWDSLVAYDGWSASDAGFEPDEDSRFRATGRRGGGAAPKLDSSPASARLRATSADQSTDQKKL